MAQKYKPIRIALDAPPGSLKSPRNYGALQLASFGALPPQAPLSTPLPNVRIEGGCNINIKDEGHTYILSPKANNSYKQDSISGEDYLTGLSYLASHDIIVRHLIMKKAKLGLTQDGNAVIKFQEKIQPSKVYYAPLLGYRFATINGQGHGKSVKSPLIAGRPFALIVTCHLFL